MNKYKTFEELKEELGDKFEEYMYKANINLLNKLHEIKEYVNKYESIRAYYEYPDGEYWETDYDDDFKEDILELLEEIE